MKSSRFAPAAIAVVLLASAVTPGQSGHDLQINLEASSTTVLTGSQVTVTMRCRNNGPTPAAAGNVSSETPAGTTLVSVATTKGEVTQQPPPGGTGSIQVQFGPLAVGEMQTVTVVLTVTATPGTNVTVMGEIQPLNPMGDGNQVNNRSQVQIQVIAPAIADLQTTITPLAATAGSDSLFDYVVEVRNDSTGDAATDVVVTSALPEGTTFASGTSSQGTVSPPTSAPPGGLGPVTARLGAVESGASATVEITVRVDADPGATLTFGASVSSSSMDPDTSDNAATTQVPVVASNQATVSWEVPEPPSDAVPLPPPQRLVVASGAAPAAFAREQRTTLMAYNVYRSNKPGVPVAAGNLLTSVPPDQTSTTAPVAPGGSFFTVTAVYDEGESAPSNEGSADVPAATLSRVKVKPSKITATGAGFSDTVTVFVDGIPFVSPAAVKKSNTKVIQKGNLLTGETLGQYLATHPNVLITFRNSNGGVAPYRHPQ